ncbi:unnamed protein product [Bemisia tabaci]|uniref:RING-type domain-containing protein n=1 Tax=Bemisia tabaci TaxID=7038 RepID=A0A9P0AAK7_BEMTA|nr:PREDICTED: uncharacterized protein LOC109035715 [Bemisia tabaci]CAH0387614.1 unnamed protein product [Bemisia tabaci]
MSLQSIFSPILGVISVFQNALLLTLNVSYGVGQLIVSTILFIATQFYELCSNLLIGIKVMIEDFCVFAFDVFNKISFFCFNLQCLLDSLFSCAVSCALFIQNAAVGTIDHLVFMVHAIANFISGICSSITAGFELFKQALILIGTSIWSSILFIPYCILALINFILTLITCGVNQIHLSILAVTDCIVLAASNVINFITDIPIESYLGLTFAIVSTFCFVKYHVLIQSLIACCFQSSYVSFLRLVSKIAVGVQRLKIFLTAGNSQNVPDEFTVFKWIETFHERYFSLSLFAKQYYDNEEPLSNEELVNRLAREQEQRLCVVCQDKGKNVILMPCRHLCLCQSCWDVIKHQGKKCPICRRFVRKVISVFS